MKRESRHHQASRIAIQLKKYRAKAGLSQTKLAEICKMKVSQINRYETATSLPTAEVILRLADALGETTDTLMGVEAEKEHLDISKLDKQVLTEKFTNLMNLPLGGQDIIALMRIFEAFSFRVRIQTMK